METTLAKTLQWSQLDLAKDDWNVGSMWRGAVQEETEGGGQGGGRWRGGAMQGCVRRIWILLWAQRESGLVCASIEEGTDKRARVEQGE